MQSLESELKVHKTTLLSITKELEQITALLSPDDHDSLRELVYHVSQVSKSLVQIETSLSTMEFGRVAKVKGNGAKSRDTDSVEIAELEESVKMLSRKNSRVLPPIPVRNVNGAKAKESDYAHIEDLEIHGNTPEVQRKFAKPERLLPYAETSMKEPVKVAKPPPSRYTEIDVEVNALPLPKRSDMSHEKGKGLKSRYVEISELKEGQSIKDCPLPPRPDEMGWDSDESPPPLPPPPLGGYDTLPRENKGPARNSGMFYPQPPQNGSLDIYNVPKSPRPLSAQEGLDIYNVPRPLDQGAAQDLYDVPRSLRDSSYDTYDVPRNVVGDNQRRSYIEPPSSSPERGTSPSLYDVPRSLIQVCT